MRMSLRRGPGRREARSVGAHRAVRYSVAPFQGAQCALAEFTESFRYLRSVPSGSTIRPDALAPPVRPARSSARLETRGDDVRLDEQALIRIL